MLDPHTQPRLSLASLQFPVLWLLADPPFPYVIQLLIGHEARSPVPGSAGKLRQAKTAGAAGSCSGASKPALAGMDITNCVCANNYTTRRCASRSPYTTHLWTNRYLDGMRTFWPTWRVPVIVASSVRVPFVSSTTCVSHIATPERPI